MPIIVTGNVIAFRGQKVAYSHDSTFESRKLSRNVDKVTFGQQKIEYRPTDGISVNV